MNAPVVAMLACPHCGGGLARAGGGLRCERGHTHDLARDGHVTLLPGGARPGGDTAEMVAARERVQAAGLLAPVTDAVVALAAAALAGGPAGGVVDVGAGTGHHLARVLDAVPDRHGLALDLSRAAARRAARAHPRAGAAVCDVWRALPVRDGAAALVLDVFAPRNGAEIRRILHPAGALLVVSPLPGHLGELVDRLGLLRVDERKEERIAASLGEGLGEVGREEVHATVAVDRARVSDLVAMGPSAWHHDPAAMADRVAELPEPLGVTLAVRVSLHRPA